MALALATVLGCGAAEQGFTPTEHVQGTTAEGLSAAFYDLQAADRQIGSVKVWSRGAWDVDGATLIYVGFTVDNGSDTPIVFETGETVLESVETTSEHLAGLPATGAVGPVMVAPRSSQTVELTFGLPRGFHPDDVQAFRVSWTTSAGAERYTQFTPFVQQNEIAYVPTSAYYYTGYPYWHPHVHWILVHRHHHPRVIVHGHRR